MKFSAERTTLLKALAHIQSVAEKRNTIPILANVLIQAAQGQLSLKATDMEIEVVEHVPASVSREGATTAPAAVLYEIVRKLPDGVAVELDQNGEDGQLNLRAGRYATRLNVLGVDDFPSMGAGDFPHSFNLASATLRGLIDRTRFAISTEETRYYLNGIYLHATDVEGEACCVRWQRMGTAWPACRHRCPPGLRAFPALSSRARPLANYASCLTRPRKKSP